MVYRGHRGWASRRYIVSGAYVAPPRQVYRQPRVIIAPQIYIAPRYRYRYPRYQYNPNQGYRYYYGGRPWRGHGYNPHIYVRPHPGGQR